MAPTLLNVFLAAALTRTIAVSAESHTISFNNQCGYGTPQLLFNGDVVSTGEDYTYEGALSSGIAYLQTGDCGFNGEYCTLLEMTLDNDGWSSADISLIPNHAFNVAAGFYYYSGCDGTGSYCADAACNTAFFVPDDNQVQVQCTESNVNLLLTFCSDSSSAGSSSSSAVATTTSASPTATSTRSSSVATSSSSSSNLVSVSVAASVGVGLDAVSTSTASRSSASAAPTCSSKRKRDSNSRRESKRSSHSHNNARRVHHA